MQPLALWGGLECSVVRIGNYWRDQVRETGHHADPVAQFERIAKLGIRTLRTPILWERCLTEGDWAWHDAQQQALQRLGITPIAGLLHHGAGPLPGGLLDPDYAAGLAAHASRVAARYPFITQWTPVNEPLTTARFACLYGHWHPHARDTTTMLRAVGAQCWAALLAMRAIRACTPGAQFIHTEDVGRTFATLALTAQAEYENSRRWLSLDLLCGRVNRDHPWRAELLDAGVTALQLDVFASGEARPDRIGVNHYVTSDRYLDHRLALYPPSLHGGNGRSAYVDTEAARVDLDPSLTGWAARLSEVWARYRLPLVVSEAHLGCDDPAEQLRWLMGAWCAAQQLRSAGAAVQAVTVWALTGLVDWNSMLCHSANHYEPGVFDPRADSAAPTLLEQAVAALAQHGSFDHPALRSPGWWQRRDRLTLRRA